MIIKNFEPFCGKHCETTATGTLLKQLDINLSEPLLFGLGEGLGFIFWNMKNMERPFLGGRIKPDLLTKNICKNLNLDLEVFETSSKKLAWENVSKYLNNQKLVGLKLDCYHLDYFSNKIHFAAHYGSIYGYDDNYAYLIDTEQQGSKVKTALKSLELARAEKGSMSSNNLSYIINKKIPNTFELNKIIKKAIYNNCLDYLNPPIKNIGYKGIFKASQEIKKWFEKTNNIKEDFQITSMLMEKAGTGGSLFRNFYRDFLKESSILLNSKDLNKAYIEFIEISKLWKEISDLFYEAGESSDKNIINKISDILKELSEKEYNTMSYLKKITEE
ncbi:MAG: BtrH N-terminal domain-containing protein [Candidatus Sericytochromatia bacterium]